jgi:hypothetical protein
MQGRLSPIINGRIQQFPTTNWKTEIELASEYKFTKMEWTIDSETLNDNPLLTSNGQNSIIEICKYNNVSIPSITCDYFMENPPWKADASQTLEIMFKIFEGMVAIADWTQGQKGGRALLRRKHADWEIIACGGAGFKDPGSITATGISREIASNITAKLNTAESSLSAQKIKQLDSFDGVVTMGHGMHHGSDSKH